MLSSMDFQKIMTAIVAAYPYTKLDLTNKLQMSVWYDNLIDLDATKLALATKKMITTYEFPSIKNLRQSYADIDMPIHVDAEEGWGLVEKAIRNYGYMRCEEAMQSLPAQVQKAVQYVGGFLAICEAENVSVIRGQFNKAMESAIRSTREEKSLGVQLTDQIKKYNLQNEQKDKLQIEIKEDIYFDINERNQDPETLKSMANVRDILNKLGGNESEK